MTGLRTVVLDCDTGSDDAIAIMMAALHPDLELLGVCTVFGNHSVEETTANTRDVLATVDRPEMPVLRGLAGPDDTATPPAVEWLVETLRATRQPVTVVPTGPLSNLAAALRRDPGLVDVVEQVVAMGGTRGIRTSATPYAERNFWNDPVAADAVLRAGFHRLVLVTLDATYQALMGAAEVAALRSLGTPAGDAAAALVRERIADYGDLPGLDGRAPVHDPLTVAYLLDPMVLSLEDARITVELDDPQQRGRTRIELGSGSPNARVALACDAERFLALLLDSLAR